MDKVRALADDICNTTNDNLLNTGFGKYAKILTDTNTKSGPTIKGGKDILFEVIWSLSPLALQQVGGAIGDVLTFCEQSVQTVATKGQGCTDDISGFIDGKSSTVTRGITGTIKILASG